MTDQAIDSGGGGSADADERVVRYGVIGTGMMGVEHISNLLAIEGAAVVAAADPDERSLDWAQHAVGTDSPLSRFADHRDLLASGECDAVVIATPNNTHHDILFDVLDSPLHVLVEKPLCTTVADCQDVIDQAAAGPPEQIVWMGLEYRYMPPTQRLLDEVRGGTVGDRADGGDPRAPLPVPAQGRQLEPLQRATPAGRSSRSAATTST